MCEQICVRSTHHPFLPIAKRCGIERQATPMERDLRRGAGSALHRLDCGIIGDLIWNGLDAATRDPIVLASTTLNSLPCKAISASGRVGMPASQGGFGFAGQAGLRGTGGELAKQFP